MVLVSPADPVLPRILARLPQTVDILTNTTFADLTGCQAQCTVQDTAFGTQSNTSDWNSPTKVVPRASNTTCNVTAAGSNVTVAGSNASRYELTEPTIIEGFDGFCSERFIAYRVRRCHMVLAGLCSLVTWPCEFALARWNILRTSTVTADALCHGFTALPAIPE